MTSPDDFRALRRWTAAPNQLICRQGIKRESRVTAILSDYLPFIVAGAGIVLIAAWIWLAPAKGTPLTPPSGSTKELAQDLPKADGEATAIDQAATPMPAKAPAKPKAKASAKPKVAASPKAEPALKEPAKPKAKAAVKEKAPPPSPVVAEASEKSSKAAANPKAVAKAPLPPVVEKPAAKKPSPKPAVAKASVRSADQAKGADNLLLIKGLGPKLNAMLGDLGVTRFDQIAAWTANDIAEIDSKLGAFAGRIGRDNFVDQAGLLAARDVSAFEAKYGKLDADLN